MSTTDPFYAYRKAVSKTLNSDVYVTFFWKGRVALYSILKSLGVGQGDEVIIPGFTCVVVANAVIYTGAKPVYADINPHTYTITRETVEPLITSNTKVLMVQNTFGLSPDLDPIMELARERKIEIIDDCTHGFGGSYKGQANGTITQTSFFSTQWNKPFSTGIGGFAVTTDQELSKRLYHYETKAYKPSNQDILMLFLLYNTKQYLLNNSLYWPLVKLYRWLSYRGLILGSSQGEELDGPEMPGNFLKGLSSFQAKVGIKSLERSRKSQNLRQGIADEYDNTLGKLEKSVPNRPEYADHLFLRYPVRVTNREIILKEAERFKVRLGDWFLSPLHPVTGDLSAWGFERGVCPNAEKIATQIVNLPTEPHMTSKELKQVKRFISNHADYFL